MLRKYKNDFLHLITNYTIIISLLYNIKVNNFDI